MPPAPIVAVCRRLARMSRFQLTATYVLCFVGATMLYDWGRASQPAATILGAFLGLVAVSLLFTVVTWYRNDPVPGAAFLLAIATTCSYLIGGWITLLFLLPGSPGAAAVMGFGAAMGLPIAILEWALVFAVLVAIGRKFRRVFAPETQADPGIGSPPTGGSAA
jgi:hypothetical protein